MSTKPQNCRSCGAAIYWLKHVNTGRPAPVDANPSPNGNIVIELEGGTYGICGKDVACQLGYMGEERYVNHFATCPMAAEWREKTKK